MLYTIHRYPTEWIDRQAMHNGPIVTVRPILPQDAPFEIVLVGGLPSESHYAHFLVGGDQLTNEVLAAYAQIDYMNHMALVVSATRPDGTGENLITDSRFTVEGGIAEFTMLVVDVWQDKGVGRRLFATLVYTARTSGMREVLGEVLSINHRIISFMRDVDFRAANVSGDATVYIVRLPLA